MTRNKANSTSNISFLELSSYVKPEVVETYGKDYVTWGENNSYFTYLINAYNESPTHKSIIKSISSLIYGRGLNALDSSQKTEQYAQMISLFKPTETRKIIKDYQLTGKYALQVIYNTKHDKIIEVHHIEVDSLAPEKANEDGVIEAYYHSVNWNDSNIKPKRIAAFGTSKDSIEILYVQQYETGYFYFSPVDYSGGSVYAEMEDEMSSFHINNLQNGFTATKLINFNNGVPLKADQKKIEQDIIKKWTGAKSKNKVVLAFNKNKDSAATVEDLQLSDAHQQYQFLSDEATEKLLRAHRVTSPILLGIRDSSGLGNNADELKNAAIFFDNTVIRPKQDEIIEGLNQILAFNGISLNLYFTTLQPLEFVDTEGIIDKETIEEETGIEACSHKLSTDKDDEVANELINLGSDFREDWDLIDERDVDYEFELFMDQELDELNNVELTSTGTASAGKKSSQDKKVKEKYYFVRYFYHPKTSSSDSREFCKRMVQAGKLYRKEDILKMDKSVVNKGWGLAGVDKYSIWKYKGGGACHHRWRRMTFVSNVKTNVRGKDAKPIGTRAAEIRGYKVTNDWEVSVRPVDMPKKGFVNK